MKATATHVLLTLVLLALVANAFLMLQAPVRAAAVADDLSEVVDAMEDIESRLGDISSDLDELDAIETHLADIADADLFDLSSASSPDSVTRGLPVVVAD